MPTIYKLSPEGRRLTFLAWKELGGCGLPNNTNAYCKLGPVGKWDKDVTLGDIADACPYTGRALAGFAVRHLNLSELAEEFEVVRRV